MYVTVMYTIERSLLQAFCLQLQFGNSVELQHELEGDGYNQEDERHNLVEWDSVDVPVGIVRSNEDV